MPSEAINAVHYDNIWKQDSLCIYKTIPPSSHGTHTVFTSFLQNGAEFPVPYLRRCVKLKKVFAASAIQAVMLAACFLFTIMASGTALATAQSPVDETDRSVFYGKVTAVDGNSITVAIATWTMPDGFKPRENGDGTLGGQNGAPGGNDPASTVRPDGSVPQGGRRNFADNLTFTGESVTVQITGSIALTKQDTQADWNKEAPNPPGQAATDGSQGNNPSGSQRPQGTMVMGQGPGFTGVDAALEDITVDSIVVLTYQTSTQALLSVHILSTPQAEGE